MSEIKNKIITISGEPASGKSTVVKKLKEKYEAMGYNVHVISTGDLFRDIITKAYLKMYPDRKDANLADIQSDETFVSRRNEIDGLVDEEMKRKGLEINGKERPNDVWIIDSRLAWHNIPSSYAIRLTIDDKIAGQRTFADGTRGEEDRYITVEDAIKKTRERKLGEIKRYKERYGVDLSNPDNYDLIVDTAYADIDELAGIIIEGEKAYRGENEYPKMWASPTNFVSGQIIKESSSYRRTLLSKKIKEEGYNSKAGTLEIVEHGGMKILSKGNHRVQVGLSMGQTLFPYIVKHKDDEISKQRVEEIYNSPCLESTYDWADVIAYFGGVEGKIEQLKGFKATDLLTLRKSSILRKRLCLDEHSEDGR